MEFGFLHPELRFSYQTKANRIFWLFLFVIGDFLKNVTLDVKLQNPKLIWIFTSGITGFQICLLVALSQLSYLKLVILDVNIQI